MEATPMAMKRDSKLEAVNVVFVRVCCCHDGWRWKGVAIAKKHGLFRVDVRNVRALESYRLCLPAVSCGPTHANGEPQESAAPNKSRQIRNKSCFVLHSTQNGFRCEIP